MRQEGESEDWAGETTADDGYCCFCLWRSHPESAGGERGVLGGGCVDGRMKCVRKEGGGCGRHEVRSGECAAEFMVIILRSHAILQGSNSVE